MEVSKRYVVVEKKREQLSIGAVGYGDIHAGKIRIVSMFLVANKHPKMSHRIF